MLIMYKSHNFAHPPKLHKVYMDYILKQNNDSFYQYLLSIPQYEYSKNKLMLAFWT